MKRVKTILLILLIIFSFSSCCSDEIYGQPGTVNPVESLYCGYYPSAHTQGKQLLKDVDRNIIFVPCGETADDFFKKLNGYEEIELTDSNGNTLADEQKLATGFLIDSKDYGDFYVVVLGDVDGDGMITENDSLRAKKYADGEQKAPLLPFVLAADVDASGAVDKTDVDLINFGTSSENQALGWYYEIKAISRNQNVAYEEYSMLLE